MSYIKERIAKSNRLKGFFSFAIEDAPIYILPVPAATAPV
jgi:hypothetical protein